MTDITIFHNPACGTSRKVLALIRHAGLVFAADATAGLLYTLNANWKARSRLPGPSR